MLLMVYQPIFTQGIERGMTAGGDFFYYFQLGALSSQGLLPFRDWWSEFPPIPVVSEHDRLSVVRAQRLHAASR